ncbi:MAG: AAA family ATPase, partial [Actinomycetota bacterium]
MQAVVFCGIQASGKSRFYAERFATTHVRINLDALKSRKEEAILLEECLTERRAFVVDNTNPTPADRERYIAPALGAGFMVIGYYFMATPREAIARSLARSGTEIVPPWAIWKTYHKLQPPGASEGFSRLTLAHLEPDGTFSVIALH